jgi:hypothetical protein
MKRMCKNLAAFLSVVVALGAIAVLWLALTQIVAAGLAVVVGMLVALAADPVSGVIAGIFAFGAVLKLIHFGDFRHDQLRKETGP